MSIEEIAQTVAAEWQMGFDGIELDFALEVARRAAAAEREACAKVCEQQGRMAGEAMTFYTATGQCAQAIRDRAL